MKVAVTVFKNGVSPRVDIADSLLIYDIENGVIQDKEECHLVFDQPPQLISFLQEKQIAAIICGGCSKFFLRMLFFHGFDVMSGVTGDPENIIQKLIDGTLNHISTEMCVPFGRKHRRRNRFQRGKTK
jgi:predicted Fe-Mo cluster-binding NifX family protein